MLIRPGSWIGRLAGMSLALGFVHPAAFADESYSIGKPALAHERFGLFPSKEFTLATGSCASCRTAKQALWYFPTDLVAIPTHGQDRESMSEAGAPPFMVWIGSPEVIEKTYLTPDLHHLHLSAHTLTTLALTPQLATNRSYYNERSAAFFAQRPIRIRGRTEAGAQGPVFTARTIWPADYVFNETQAIHDASLSAPSITQMIEADQGGAMGTFSTQVLWKRPNQSSTWAGKPVLGLVLNGAQGDDDEAHGGHFGIFTGRVGPGGEWADWLVNNFYAPDVVSEKGIIPAMLPMDNYLYELNSGQSYYRPSYLLVFVLKQERTAAAYQSAIQADFLRLYRHEIDYDHSLANCAGLSIDALRRLGWQIPLQGSTSRLKAAGAFVYMAVTDRGLANGRKLYHYFSEEQTRLLPRITFEAIARDALALMQRDPSATSRSLTDYEEWLQDDIEAIVFVRIPQVPSDRAFGNYPVASLDEYQQRVPKDHAQWKTIDLAPRPFPDKLRATPHTISSRIFLQSPILVGVSLLFIGTLLIAIVTKSSRRRSSKDNV